MLGVSGASAFYKKEKKQIINEVIECEKTWQKYRSITEKKNTFDLAEKVDFELMNEELKKIGLDLDKRQTEIIVNETFKHGMDYVPIIGPLVKKIIKANQLAPSQKTERNKCYQEEVLPKCQKIREWQKEMEKVKKKNK